MTLIDRIRAALPARIELSDLITAAATTPDGTHVLTLTVSGPKDEYALLDNVDDLANMLPMDGYKVRVDGAVTQSAVITPVTGTDAHLVRIPSEGREIMAPTLECALSHVFGIVNG